MTDRKLKLVPAPLPPRTSRATSEYAEMAREFAGSDHESAKVEGNEVVVRPTDRVTFLGERNGYLLVGGRPYTNAVWLYVGPSDSAALDYFARHDGMPDVVFVDHMALVKEQQPSYQSAAKTDPMLRRVLAEYRLVETVADFGVFVRR